MTAVLISIAVERTPDGDKLVTTWEPTPAQLVEYHRNAPHIAADPNLRLVRTEVEPWSDERLAELFATYGERPVLVQVSVSRRESPR
jgi:hypothetical protein